MDELGTYDPQFYNVIRGGAQSSAAAVAPLVFGLVRPASVIDVGCGEGWWAQAFAELGADVIGLDGAYVETSPLGDRFVPHDLAEELPELGPFDLAVCLEVAEHLPAERAAGLVADLVRLAPVVLFSAAIPGQGGTGHVNEQWPRYWTDLFEAQGYAVSGALRWQIWDDDRVENWYRQNLLVAVGPSARSRLDELISSPMAYPWPVVHPVLYQARSTL